MTHTLRLQNFGERGLAWAQDQVQQFHYLRKPVDPRSRPFAYVITSDSWDFGPPAFANRLGCLIFGRPEATRCYDGNLRYGSQHDVDQGRADFDRWEILNLARVWLDPRVQRGGASCRRYLIPGYTDRRGVWQPALASWAIREALATIGFDYLQAHPPVWVEQPYHIKAVLSYCDLSKHKGTIYHAAGWSIARRNDRGIETWYTTDVCPLSPAEDDAIRKLARTSERSRRLRARAYGAEQTRMAV